MEDALYSELLVELECPVCTNYMVPPIRQCSTGHSICQDCRKKLPKCPLCQSKFTESKNISLEALACKMHYPCINRSSGCMEKLTFENRDVHEKFCNYKGFKCPMERCPWVGRFEDVVAHWDSKKMTSKPYQANNVCHTKLKSESYYVNIVKAHNQLFWFKCKSTNGKIFWSVQFIGSSSEAENYYYEIDIFKPSRPKCKIVFSNYCQVADIENDTLFNDGVCTSMSTDVVSAYAGDDMLLIYYMRVMEINKSASAKGNPEFVRKDQDFKQRHRDNSQGPRPHFQQGSSPNNQGHNPHSKGPNQHFHRHPGQHQKNNPFKNHNNQKKT